MKKFMLGTLIMIAGLFPLATGVQAETGGVMVHMDQDFVAGGKAFPAGTYKVYDSSPLTIGETLILRDEESGASIFLIPSKHDSMSTGALEMKLTRVGGVYYLSEISTDLGVYSFGPPRELKRTAKLKDQDGPAPWGSN